MFLSGMLTRRQMRVKASHMGVAASAARLLPAFAWMAGIFYLSHQSTPLGGPSSPWEPVMAHLGLYAVLAVLLIWPGAGALGGLKMPWFGVLAVVFALTLLYGATDELHQAWIPGRTASISDLAIDAAGAASGLGLMVAAAEVSRFRGIRR